MYNIESVVTCMRSLQDLIRADLELAERMGEIDTANV